MEYTVILSIRTRERVEALAEQAARHGQGGEALRAVRSLAERLQVSPHTEGEFKYHTPAGFPVRQLLLPPFSVWFATYDERRIVWVFRVDLLSAADE